ncbi:MAG: hypothetical protein K0U38_11720 [Epsilonproteobacteria bacterium]|nr:hypothetical protein [Campylobacterota bacterium]
MKKILLMAVMASSMLLAEGNVTAESNATSTAQTMQHLEASMQMIQKGFLYNSEGMVDEGVKQFKVGLGNMDAFVVKVDDKDKGKSFDPQSYALTESKALMGMANDILKSFKSGEKDKASESYTKTLNRCLACHKIIR